MLLGFFCVFLGRKALLLQWWMKIWLLRFKEGGLIFDMLVFRLCRTSKRSIVMNWLLFTTRRRSSSDRDIQNADVTYKVICGRWGRRYESEWFVRSKNCYIYDQLFLYVDPFIFWFSYQLEPTHVHEWQKANYCWISVRYWHVNALTNNADFSCTSFLQYRKHVIKININRTIIWVSEFPFLAACRWKGRKKEPSMN